MKQVHWNLCETFDLEYESAAGSHAVIDMYSHEDGLKCDIILEADDCEFGMLIGTITCPDYDYEGTRKYAMNMLNNEEYMTDLWQEILKERANR